MLPSRTLSRIAPRSPYWEIQGPDGSNWNAPADKDTVLLEADFGIFRALDGYYVGRPNPGDPSFGPYWAQFNGKIPTGSYMYYRSDKDPGLQAAAYINVIESVGGRMGEIGPVGDFEENAAGLTPTKYTDNMIEYLSALDYYMQAKAHPLKYAGIYTRATFWNGLVQHWRIPNLAKRVKTVAFYSISGYVKEVPNNYIPLGWLKKYDFHQFTDKGGVPWGSPESDWGGHLWGFASKSLDINSFHGTRQEFLERFKITLGPDPIPTSCTPNPGVNMRTAPIVVPDNSNVAATATGDARLPVIGRVTGPEDGRIWYQVALSRTNTTPDHGLYIASWVVTPHYD